MLLYRSFCLVANSCPTPCDFMDSSPPGSCVHGTPSPMDPGIKPKSPVLVGRFFTAKPPGNPLYTSTWASKNKTTMKKIYTKETKLIWPNWFFVSFSNILLFPTRSEVRVEWKPAFVLSCSSLPSWKLILASGSQTCQTCESKRTEIPVSLRESTPPPLTTFRDSKAQELPWCLLSCNLTQAPPIRLVTSEYIENKPLSPCVSTDQHQIRSSLFCSSKYPSRWFCSNYVQILINIPLNNLKTILSKSPPSGEMTQNKDHCAAHSIEYSVHHILNCAMRQHYLVGGELRGPDDMFTLPDASFRWQQTGSIQEPAFTTAGYTSGSSITAASGLAQALSISPSGPDPNSIHSLSAICCVLTLWKGDGGTRECSR